MAKGLFMSAWIGAAWAGAATGAADATGNEAADRLEEVVVTARRRQEVLQDTPVSVTALSSRHLAQTGARDFEDFAVTVPGLSYVGNNSPENKIVLRGVSTGVASRDEGSVLGLYIDDVPVGSRRFNPDLRLYDVERIEVLRGPQGTLFGEGSIGGTLRFITRKPDLATWSGSVQGNASVTAEGGTNYRGAGLVNIPVMEDVFGLRVLGYYEDDSGYVDNIATGRESEDVNSLDTTGGRVVALYRPRDTVSATLSVLYQDSSADGKAQYDPAIGDPATVAQCRGSAW